jgi:hypothetical protein
MVRWAILRFFEAYFRHPRRYWIPVGIMLVLAGINLGLSNSTYISRSTLYVEKTTLLSSLSSLREDGLSWVTPAEATTGELKEMLATDAFVRSMIQLTDLEASMTGGPEAVDQTLQEARKAVWVEALGTNLVQVSGAHENPEIARQLVSAVVEIYLRWKINADRDEGAAALSFLNEQVAVYRAQLQSAEADLLAYLETHPEPLHGERPANEAVEISRLQRAVEAATDAYDKAQEDLQSSQFNAAVVERQVRRTYLLVDAPLESEPPGLSKKKLLFSFGVFGAVGCMLSVLMVAGAALLDRTLHFAGEGAGQLNLAVLTVLPEFQLSGENQRGFLWKGSFEGQEDQ